MIILSLTFQRDTSLAVGGVRTVRGWEFPTANIGDGDFAISVGKEGSTMQLYERIRGERKRSIGLSAKCILQRL